MYIYIYIYTHTCTDMHTALLLVAVFHPALCLTAWSALSTSRSGLPADGSRPRSRATAAQASQTLDLGAIVHNVLYTWKSPQGHLKQEAHRKVAL